jgi:small subunit ribosomal protein S21
MPFVTLRDGESGEAMVSRFTKLVQKEGVLTEFKRRRFFISESEQRRMAAQKAARKRARRAARRPIRN